MKATGIKARLGKCYELAGRYALDHPDAVLVHGSIQGNGHPRLGHAWVVLASGQRLDLVTEYELPRDAFERFFNAEVDATYTHTELCLQIVDAKTWGPWTKEER